MVHLTDEDLKTLPTRPEKPPAEFNSASGTSSRTVVNNLTYDQAVQVNASIGKDGWTEVNSLTIKDNVARGYSTQINHGISRQDFQSAITGRFASLKS